MSVINGTMTDNTISATRSDDIIYGNKGNDTIYDFGGNDTYKFNLNDGQDFVVNYGGTDKIVFGPGITKKNLKFTKQNSDLIISINNSLDQIIISNWFRRADYVIEKFEFADGTSINNQDVDNDINNLPINNIIYGTSGNDSLGGSGIGVVTMEGGLGDDTYFVNNSNDIVIEKSSKSILLDSSWIKSKSVRDIYTRTFPRVMGNQWHVNNDGMFTAAVTYKTVNGKSVIDWEKSWQKNDKLLQMAANYFDYIVLNRDGVRSGVIGEYADLFLDNYDSIKNPNKGLGAVLKWLNQLTADSSSHLYILPYLNMTDVTRQQSIKNNPNWNFWHSRKYFNGQNFGTWDYANNNKLFITKNGEIFHFYYSLSGDGIRYAFNSNNPSWQQYYIDHVKGLIEAGFDGVFSDNWARTPYGDIKRLTNSEFLTIQQGWNSIGAGIKKAIGDDILIGNSPSFPVYNSRDISMLEDRIDDVLGTNDKSVASYFRYSDLSQQDKQVCQDTYYDETYGPFETFRLPMNLLTNNILGLTAVTTKGTSIENYIKPLVTIGDIGDPLGNRQILAGTDTGIKDTINNYSVNRAVYVRYFSYGVAYLNDTGSRQTIKLPSGNWLRSDGVKFFGGDKITLDSLRGWVFKKTDSNSLSLNEGNDTVYSTVSYTLPEDVENLILTGSNILTATGNELDNKIYANPLGSVLYGMDGNDTLYGNTGNDSLYGGTGNDTYYFNLGDNLDTITDFSGTDLVQLGNNVNRNKVAFLTDSTSLYIDYGDSTGADKVTINNCNIVDNQIESIQLNDGSYLTNTEINTIIQNMTTYATANNIALTNVSDVKNNSELMNLFMVNSWHA